MMVDMIRWAREQGWDVALYTNRRTLCAQLKGVLESFGIEVGMRAAGYKPALLRPVQLCMTQTEGSAMTRRRRSLHPAKLVLIDERHLQQGETMRKISEATVEAGGFVVGYTATPLDLDFCDHLIVATSISECFDSGSLVRAKFYAPDEPDLKHIKKYAVGQDFSEPDNVKAIMRPGVFGRVREHWEKYNPDRWPTILFGPDVKGALFFAEQFYASGIRAAHIDGQNVWLDGEQIGNTNEDAREYVLDLVRCGHVPIVTNRYVLREGLDVPEFRYGILATVFGALSSYIQSCGRLLRSCPGKDHAIIQDHGGNYNRFGSINSDREWLLGLTNHRAVGELQSRMRQGFEVQPVTCPNCLGMRMGGAVCPHCGYEHKDRSRTVVQVDGQLKRVKGDVYRPRVTKTKPNTAEVWKRYYYSQKRAGRTFNQAEAWFYRQEGYYPPRNLPLMPKETVDWFSKIKDVPTSRLQESEVA